MAQVRSGTAVCRFFNYLALQKRPKAILEFGAAFGASGMYWLAGLSEHPDGTLYSFEPNTEWCAIARGNFAHVSERFVLTETTFEGQYRSVPACVEVAFIDAIHTKDFVLRQFDLVREVCAKRAIVIFDDIHFSPDMRDCWAEICARTDLPGAWQIGKRVGLVELP